MSLNYHLYLECWTLGEASLILYNNPLDLINNFATLHMNMNYKFRFNDKSHKISASTVHIGLELEIITQKHEIQIKDSGT